MFKLLRYFLFTILFTSMGFGFIVGDWDFEDNNNDYLSNSSTGVKDKSGNNITGGVKGGASLSDNTPRGLGGTSVHFPDEWKGSRGEIYIKHDDKMLLDSGKVSFWFQVEDFEEQHYQKGEYKKGLVSKDAAQTRDSGDLTFFIADHKAGCQHEELGSWPTNIDNHDEIYLGVRLQTSSGSNNSELSYCVMPDKPLQENKWYFLEYIFGSSDFGMKVTLYNEDMAPIGKSNFPFYGGVSDVYGYDVDKDKVSDINGTHETMGLGGLSWGDNRGESGMYGYYAGYMDALKWETYEEPVLIHYFDECEQSDGDKLKNYANDYTAGEASNTVIKGSTSVMAKEGKIYRAVDLKANTDYVELDREIINSAKMKDFSIIMWINTQQNGTIISTNNNDIALELKDDEFIAHVKGQSYTFKLNGLNIKDNTWHQIVLTRKVHIVNQELNDVSSDFKDSYETQAKIEMLIDNTFLGKYITTISSLSSVADAIDVSSMRLGEGFVGKIDEFTLLKNKLSRYTVSTIIDYAKDKKNWDGRVREEIECLATYDGTISINDISHKEGDLKADGTAEETPFNFSVKLSEAFEEEITVNYLISDGDTGNNPAQKDDNDYKFADGYPQTGSVTFQPGVQNQTINVVVLGDTKVEPDETFKVTLTGTNYGEINGTGIGIGTIENDDTESTFSITNSTVTEGDPLKFVVTLDNPINTDAVINIGYQDGTATHGVDYGDPSVTSVTIPAGETTSAEITVPTIIDDIYEGSESMEINATTVSGNIQGTVIGTGIIEDNNTKPTISISDTRATEGSDLVFDITLSGKSAEDTTIKVATHDNSAIAPEDYTAIYPPIIVTIPAGETSAEVNVTTRTDEIIEGDENMLFYGTVTSDNTDNKNPSGIGTITDDDHARISIHDINKSEGNEGDNTPFGFKVSIDPADIVDITLSYRTSDGNATTEDKDYNGTTGEITIPAGDTSATIDINVIGDNTVEPDEDFYVTIAKVSEDNSTIARSIGRGIIENDDNVTITIDDVNLTEGDSGLKDFNFTVTLSSPHTEQIELKYHTEETQFRNDNATADTDYKTITEGILTFKPGESGSKIVTVKVVGDRIIENNETFYVKLDLLSSTSDTYLIDDTGLGTIINDDFRTPSALVTFNVERTNSADDEIGSDERNAWYTQVTGRTFAYDVVCYLAGDSPTEYVPYDMPVKIDLMSDKNNIIDTRYAYFNNSSRAHLTNVIVDEASKDARFVVRVPTDGTTIYSKDDCDQDNDAKACYEELLRKDPISVHSHDAKDNFAIRPAGFKYTIGGGDTPLIDNSTENDALVHLAAGLSYKFYAKALRYDGNSSNIEGYTGAKVERKLKFALNGDCADANDKTEEIQFNYGVRDEAAFDINQTGKYTLNLLDNTWTAIDNNGRDCKADNSDITIGINDLQGCDINSTMKINGIDYTDQTITVHPHHFAVDIDASSNPKGLEVIYMNTIAGDNTKMSRQLDVNITAQADGDDINLTNFTEGCMAKNLSLEFDFSSTPGLGDINDSNDGTRNLLLTVDGSAIQTIETQKTKYDAGIKAEAFKADQKGRAEIKVNYNINRVNTATVNPVTVKLNALHVTSLDTTYDKIKNDDNVVPSGEKDGPDGDTFLYARVRPSQKLYEGLKDLGKVATRLAIDVYCLDPINNSCRDNANIPLYGRNTSESSSGWWLATRYIHTNQAGVLALINSNNLDVAINPNTNINFPSDADKDEDDLNNIVNAISHNIMVDCPTNENDIADISLNEIDDPTSPWLIYDNNPLYRVKCSNGSTWAGRGSEGNVLGGVIQRGGQLIDPNRQAPDASAIRRTHRMSW